MRSDYFGRVSSKGLENVSRFTHLFAELVRLGFYERDIAKITSGGDRRPAPKRARRDRLESGIVT
jgi:microsomal dipeptidase-like Zn-dependent dipeptidase